MQEELGLAFEEGQSYYKRVQQASNFAKGTTGAAWNGVYLMGLTLVDLELIPVSSMIKKKWYWITARNPDPEAPDDWDPSWIVESDTFNKI